MTNHSIIKCMNRNKWRTSWQLSLGGRTRQDKWSYLRKRRWETILLAAEAKSSYEISYHVHKIWMNSIFLSSMLQPRSYENPDLLLQAIHFYSNCLEAHQEFSGGIIYAKFFDNFQCRSFVNPTKKMKFVRSFPSLFVFSLSISMIFAEIKYSCEM